MICGLRQVVLAPGLYNANAMESIASAMEISVIGARNAARLLVDASKRSLKITPKALLVGSRSTLGG